MDVLTGQIAAVGAAMCFAINSTMLTQTGKQFGPVMAMRGMLPLALVWVALLHTFTLGWPRLGEVEFYRIFYLSLSGIVGFAFGGVLVTGAFLRIGPRLSALVTALGPVFSTTLAWLFLGETLSTLTLLGIVTTIAGILFVVSEKRKAQDNPVAVKDYRLGLLMAFGAAVVQGVIFIFNRQGVAGDFEPFTGSLIRLLAGTLTLWTIAAFRRDITRTLKAYAGSMQGLRVMLIASVIGPTIGVSLVLVALQNAPVGIASTLANLTPIFLIPISYIFFGERITRRAILGTLIAFAGTVMLFV